MTTEQLTAFLQSTLETIVCGIHGLDDHPATWQESISGPATIEDKLIVETLLLVLLVARVPGLPSKLRDDLRQICEYCAPRVYNSRNLALLARYPQMAVALGIGHLALRGTGYANDKFGKAIEAAFVSQRVFAIERLPYRTMEVRWLKSMLFPTRPAQFDDLLSASLVQANAHPLRMSTADNYALTHALMYITDFGNHPLPTTLSAEHLAAQIDIALAAQVVSENLDIMGELLMSAIFLGRPWSVRAHFSWHLLSETWTQYGFLPCPSLNTSEYAVLRGSEARAYAFKHTYHTTYVGAILCSLLLRHPAFLTKTTTSEMKLAASSLPAILSRLDACPTLLGLRTCQWTKTLPGAPIDSEELTRLLNDGLAVHAAQHYDLVTLCGLLADYSVAGLPLSKTLTEAAEFLAEQHSAGALPEEVCHRIVSVLSALT